MFRHLVPPHRNHRLVVQHRVVAGRELVRVFNGSLEHVAFHNAGHAVAARRRIDRKSRGSYFLVNGDHHNSPGSGHLPLLVDHLFTLDNDECDALDVHREYMVFGLTGLHTGNLYLKLTLGPSAVRYSAMEGASRVLQ